MSEQAPVVDQASVLRAMAFAKKEKTGKRVKSDTLLGITTKFLNDNTQQFIAVTDVFPSNTTASAIVNRFRTVVIASKLDELCYPIEQGGTVFLTKLYDPTVENDNDDNDTTDDEVGVEAIAD